MCGNKLFKVQRQKTNFIQNLKTKAIVYSKNYINFFYKYGLQLVQWIKNIKYEVKKLSGLCSTQKNISICLKKI